MDHQNNPGKLQRRSNDKKAIKTDESNERKNTETRRGGGDKEKLELIKLEEKHLVNRHNLKRLKEYYDNQRKKIDDIKEKVEAFEHRDKDFLNTFSGVCKYDDHLRTRIGDNVTKRINTLRESAERVQTMFYEISNSSKFDAKRIQELFERIQTQENAILRMNEYVDNFLKNFEHTKIITEHQMDLAKKQKSNLKETLEKVLIDVRTKEEEQFQLEKELSVMGGKFQNFSLEKDTNLTQELTLIELNLKRQTERIETELNRFQLELEEMSNDFDLLTCTLTEKNTNIDSLNILVTEKDHKLEVVNAKVAQLCANLNEKEEELQSLKQTLLDRKIMTRKVSSELESLMQYNSENCNEVEKLKAILQSKKEKLSSLSEEVNNQRDLETRQLREKEHLKEKLKQFEQHNSSIFSQINEQKKLGKSKDDQIKELVSKVQQLKLKIQAEYEENRNLREEEIKIATEKGQKNDILQKEVSNLHSTALKGDQIIQEMMIEKIDLEMETKQIYSNISEVEQKMRLVETMNNELKGKIKAREEEMNKFKNELSRCANELKYFTNSEESSKHSCPEKTETVVSQEKQLPEIIEGTKYPNIDALLNSKILIPTTTTSVSSYQNFVEWNASNLSDEDFVIQHLLSDPDFFSKLNQKDSADDNTKNKRSKMRK